MGGSGGGGRGHGALEGWGRVLAPRTPWAWPWAWPCLGFCLVTCSRSVGPWWGWAGWFWAGRALLGAAGLLGEGTGEEHPGRCPQGGGGCPEGVGWVPSSLCDPEEMGKGSGEWMS